MENTYTCYRNNEQYTFSFDRDLRAFLIGCIEPEKIPQNWDECNIEILFDLSGCTQKKD